MLATIGYGFGGIAVGCALVLGAQVVYYWIKDRRDQREHNRRMEQLIKFYHEDNDNRF